MADKESLSLYKLHTKIRGLYLNTQELADSILRSQDPDWLEKEFNWLWRESQLLDEHYEELIYFRRARLSICRITGDDLLIEGPYDSQHSCYHELANWLASSCLLEVEECFGTHSRVLGERVILDDPKLDFTKEIDKQYLVDLSENFDNSIVIQSMLNLEVAAIDAEELGSLEFEPRPATVSTRKKAGPCPSCKSPNTTVRTTKRTLRYLECSDCGNRWKAKKFTKNP